MGDFGYSGRQLQRKMKDQAARRIEQRGGLVVCVRSLYRCERGDSVFVNDEGFAQLVNSGAAEELARQSLFSGIALDDADARTVFLTRVAVTGGTRQMTGLQLGRVLKYDGLNFVPFNETLSLKTINDPEMRGIEDQLNEMAFRQRRTMPDIGQARSVRDRRVEITLDIEKATEGIEKMKDALAKVGDAATKAGKALSDGLSQSFGEIVKKMPYAEGGFVPGPTAEQLRNLREGTFYNYDNETAQQRATRQAEAAGFEFVELDSEDDDAADAMRYSGGRKPFLPLQRVDAGAFIVSTEKPKPGKRQIVRDADAERVTHLKAEEPVHQRRRNRRREGDEDDD